MDIDDQIKDEKVQYGINREAAKLSALSSGKIEQYEYLSCEEILPSNQKLITEQAKFTYSPLGKTFEKQTKAIEDQGKNQISAMKNHGKEIIDSKIVDKNYFGIDRNGVSYEKMACRMKRNI